MERERMRQPTRRQMVVGTGALAASTVIPAVVAASGELIAQLIELEQVRARCNALSVRAGRKQGAWREYDDAMAERDRLIDQILRWPGSGALDVLVKVAAVSCALLDDDLILDQTISLHVAVLAGEARQLLT